MKKLLVAFFLHSVSFSFAQQVSDYKYVIVPNTFVDFAKEDYQLNTYLKTLLRKKKYEIIVEGSKDIPSDLKHNLCLASKADIQNIKSSFQNKLKVVFKDCNDTILSEYEGVSKIEDFEKGYQEALNLAIVKLPLQNAKEIKMPTITVKSKETKTYTVIGEENGEIKIPIDSSKIKNNEILFESKGVTYRLIELAKDKAQLINVQNQKPILNIYPSSKDKVVHVEVFSEKGNYNTLGYVEDQNLIIEFKEGNETWTKTEFEQIKKP